MIIGVLGVLLWLLVWAPWGSRARSRRMVYRREVPPDEVAPRRGYRAGGRYEDEVREDEYRDY